MKTPKVPECLTVDLPDEAATRQLGERLGRLARPGDVLLLEGDLGAGKTTLAQGIAAGLGCEEGATSPTFALVYEIPGRLTLRHMDLYRLDPSHLPHLGVEEWFGDDAVAVVEWAERLGAYKPRDHLTIALSHHGDGRRAHITASGPHHAALLEALRSELALAG